MGDAISTPIDSAAPSGVAAARSNVDPRIAYDDLRQWIEEARKLGEIKEVKNLSWQRDIGMVAEMALRESQMLMDAEMKERHGYYRPQGAGIEPVRMGGEVG